MRLVWLTYFVGISFTTSTVGFSDCQVNVSAATSLRSVAEDLGAGFEAQHKGCQVNLNTSGSHALARQVKAGAAVDVFLPASESVKNLMAVVPVKEGILARGQLVLAGNIQTSTEEELLSKANRIAVGQKTLPAGNYAHQYLGERAVKLKKKLVYADNVRGVLAMLERGAVAAAFVYHTELMQSENKSVVLFPIDRVKVIYPKWLLSTSKTALQFYEYLASPVATKLLSSHHFLSASTDE